MVTVVSLLPPGFEPLEPYVEYWALATANERAMQRLDSTEAERIEFFEAAKDLLAHGLDYLDKKPFTEYDDDEKRLMQLLLSFVHIAMAVEIQQDGESGHAEGARHITITRAPSQE